MMITFRNCPFSRNLSGSVKALSLQLAVIATGLFLMTEAASLSAAESTLSFSGTAYNEAGKQIYTETHKFKGNCSDGVFVPQSDHVTYSSSSGDHDKDAKTVATKKLTFSQSPLRPTFVMEQPGFHETMSVTNDDDQSAAIEWRDPEGKTHNTKLDITGDMVFDSGFVNLVQQNWQALKNGETVNFEFLSSTRAETYSFEAMPVSDSRIKASLVIRMQSKGTVLGWFFDPITLGFDNQGRLTHYDGLTNIRKNADENYSARIDYEKPELPCPLVNTTEHK